MFKKILSWVGKKLSERECRAGHHKPEVGFMNDYCGRCGIILNEGLHSRWHDMVRRNEWNLPEVTSQGMFYADVTTCDGSNSKPVLTKDPCD